MTIYKQDAPGGGIEVWMFPGDYRALGGPSLSLEFARTPYLDPRVTFTRASSATYFNSTGLLTTAANDAPRFDYDPVTLRCSGLLIEEQRTNLLLHSRDMTQAAWSKALCTVARNAVGIDGTANSACTLTDTVAAGNKYIQQVTTANANNPVTVSAVIKAGTQSKTELRLSTLVGGCIAHFDLVSRTAAHNSVYGTGYTGSGTATITDLGGGWFRCAYTHTTTDTGTISGSVFMRNAAGLNSYTGDGTGTIIVDAAQLEVGAFATSIITTGAATVTRAADSASMTGANFSSWYNQTQGTFVVEADLQQKAVQQSVATADDTTINNRIEIAANSAWKGRLQVVSGGVSQADVNSVGSVIAANTTYKICAVYAASDFQVALGGSLGTAVTSGTVPTVTRLVIGSRSDGVTTYNGHIRRLTYYPTRLSNATLQALTL